jgi:hypothetical protein
MSKEYTKYDKKKLIDRIGKIYSKDRHKEIKTIIETNNPNLENTRNRYGVFFHFNDLTKKTYSLIETYLDKYEKQRSKLSEKASENIVEISSSESDDNNFNNSVKKLKLTNAEQHILNQVKYKNTTSKFDEVSESDIFLKKKPIKKIKK